MGIIVFNKEEIQYGTTVTLETVICCRCAVPFAMPTQLQQHFKDSKETFYCPNGHSQVYRKSTEQELRETLEEEKRQRSQSEQALKAKLFEKQEEADNWRANWQKQLKEKQKAERTLKRVHKGVCPCCNRTFDNLAKHMQTKHPEVVNKK